MYRDIRTVFPKEARKKKQKRMSLPEFTRVDTTISTEKIRSLLKKGYEKIVARKDGKIVFVVEVKGAYVFLAFRLDKRNFEYAVIARSVFDKVIKSKKGLFLTWVTNLFKRVDVWFVMSPRVISTTNLRKQFGPWLKKK